MIITDNKCFYLMACLLGFLLLVGSYLPLMARELNQDSALILRKEGAVKPLGALLKVIASRHPHFTFSEAQLTEQRGQYLYKVNIITKQRIARTIIIDATTSSFIEDKVDN